MHILTYDAALCDLTEPIYNMRLWLQSSLYNTTLCMHNIIMHAHVYIDTYPAPLIGIPQHPCSPTPHRIILYKGKSAAREVE